MNRMSLLCIVALLTVVLVGCGSNGDGTPTDSTSVKTMDEYRTEAEKDITADNAEAELSRLEKEIEGDTD
jgi:uncharacterized protein YcfL